MLKEFEFYLNAWLYCKENSIPFDTIKKQSFKVWGVEVENDTEETAQA